MAREVTPTSADEEIVGLSEHIDAMHASTSQSSIGYYIKASEIGNDCERDIWMTWRWCSPPKSMSGDRVRILRRGGREEDRIIDDLRAVGFIVSNINPDTGRQWGVTAADGHLRGYSDGAISDPSGRYLEPGTWALLEVKSANAENFRALIRRGLKLAQPKHYAQIQLYGYLMGLKQAVYFSRNKDKETDRIIRVPLVPEDGRAIVERAERIVQSEHAPIQLSTDPNYFRCRMCANRDVCHGLARPLRNCRTCIFARPGPNGSWQCRKFNKDLSADEQRAGCPQHRYETSLIPGYAVLVDFDLGIIQYETPDGRGFTDNGMSK